MRNKNLVNTMTLILALAVTIAFSFTPTSYYQIRKPATGDTNWGDDVNYNWDVIDQALHDINMTYRTNYGTNAHIFTIDSDDDAQTREIRFGGDYAAIRHTKIDNKITFINDLLMQESLEVSGIFNLGDDSNVGSIDTSNWDISTNGDFTGGSCIVSGALSFTGQGTLGNGTSDIYINSNDWDISSTGDMTGFKSGSFSELLSCGDMEIAGTLEVGGDSTIGGNVNLDNGKWIGLGSGQGRITFEDESRDELIISNAALGINNDPSNTQLFSVTNGDGTQYELTYFGTSGYSGANCNFALRGINTNTGGTAGDVFNSCRGLWGAATGASNYNIGVYGYAANGATNFAGYFGGNVHVTGELTAGTKTFVIDHPSDPDNKILVHSVYEGDKRGLIYNGKATLKNGRAKVSLPGYFEDLACDDDRNIQLTPIGADAGLYVLQEIQNGGFIVAATRCLDCSFYWQVTAVRCDQQALENPLIVEQEKYNPDTGKGDRRWRKKKRLSADNTDEHRYFSSY